MSKLLKQQTVHIQKQTFVLCILSLIYIFPRIQYIEIQMQIYLIFCEE